MIVRTGPLKFDDCAESNAIMSEIETRPDPRLPLDRNAIDVHATLLIGEKVQRDAVRKPLGLLETIAVVVATVLMIGLVAALML